MTWEEKGKKRENKKGEIKGDIRVQQIVLLL